MRNLEDDAILKTIARMVVPFIIVFGIYVILNGHISPGGGFSGGTIIAAGFILWHAAFGFDGLRKYFDFKKLGWVNTIALIAIALVNIPNFIMGSMGYKSIFPLLTPGNIISATTVLLLDIAVGIKVACTMYELYAIFTEGEV